MDLQAEVRTVITGGSDIDFGLFSQASRRYLKVLPESQGKFLRVLWERAPEIRVDLLRSSHQYWEETDRRRRSEINQRRVFQLMGWMDSFATVSYGPWAASITAEGEMFFPQCKLIRGTSWSLERWATTRGKVLIVAVNRESGTVKYLKVAAATL